MRGPDHYAEAERLLAYAKELEVVAEPTETGAAWLNVLVTEAQVHATLAQVAVLATLVPPDGSGKYNAWHEATS